MPTKRKSINITGTSRLEMHNTKMADAAVIAHLAPIAPDTVLIHDQQLTGTRRLYSYGLYACDSCGHINPIDRHNCRQCSEPKFINLNN